MHQDVTPYLGMSHEDIQSMAQGAVKGALHTESIDDIVWCVTNPVNHFEDIKGEMGSALQVFSSKDID